MSNMDVTLRVRDEFTSPLRRFQTATAHTMDKIKTRFTGTTAAVERMQRVSWRLGLTGAAIGAGFLLATKTSMSFLAEMSKVGAVVNATTLELKGLIMAAREIAKTTPLFAKEAAQTLYILGQAGFSAKEATKLLSDVATLALATNRDLKLAGAIMAETAHLFGNALGDTTIAMNVFAQATAASHLQLSDIQQAMKYVGGTASALDVDMRDLVAAFGLMADNGIRGSKAGAALNMYFQRLLNPTAAATRVLKAHGISIMELTDTIKSGGGLVKALELLTKAQFDAGETAIIFGNRQGSKLIKLIEGGSKALTEYKEKFILAGKATELAAKKIDNLEGDLTKLKNQFEEFLQIIGDSLTPISRQIVQAFEQVAKAVNNIPAPILAWGTALGALGSVLLVTIAILGHFTSTIMLGISVYPQVAITIRDYIAALSGANKTTSTNIALTNKQTNELIASGLTVKNRTAAVTNDTIALAAYNKELEKNIILEKNRYSPLALASQSKLYTQQKKTMTLQQQMDVVKKNKPTGLSPREAMLVAGYNDKITSSKVSGKDWARLFQERARATTPEQKRQITNAFANSMGISADALMTGILLMPKKARADLYNIAKNTLKLNPKQARAMLELRINKMQLNESAYNVLKRSIAQKEFGVSPATLDKFMNNMGATQNMYLDAMAENIHKDIKKTHPRMKTKISEDTLYVPKSKKFFEDSVNNIINTDYDDIYNLRNNMAKGVADDLIGKKTPPIPFNSKNIFLKDAFVKKYGFETYQAMMIAEWEKKASKGMTPAARAKLEKLLNNNFRKTIEKVKIAKGEGRALSGISDWILGGAMLSGNSIVGMARKAVGGLASMAYGMGLLGENTTAATAALATNTGTISTWATTVGIKGVATVAAFGIAITALIAIIGVLIYKWVEINRKVAENKVLMSKYNDVYSTYIELLKIQTEEEKKQRGFNELDVTKIGIKRGNFIRAVLTGDQATLDKIIDSDELFAKSFNKLSTSQKDLLDEYLIPDITSKETPLSKLNKLLNEDLDEFNQIGILLKRHQSDLSNKSSVIEKIIGEYEQLRQIMSGAPSHKGVKQGEIWSYLKQYTVEFKTHSQNIKKLASENKEILGLDLYNKSKSLTKLFGFSGIEYLSKYTGNDFNNMISNFISELGNAVITNDESKRLNEFINIYTKLENKIAEEENRSIKITEKIKNKLELNKENLEILSREAKLLGKENYYLLEANELSRKGLIDTFSKEEGIEKVLEYRKAELELTEKINTLRIKIGEEEISKYDRVAKLIKEPLDKQIEAYQNIISLTTKRFEGEKLVSEQLVNFQLKGLEAIMTKQKELANMRKTDAEKYIDYLKKSGLMKEGGIQELNTLKVLQQQYSTSFGDKLSYQIQIEDIMKKMLNDMGYDASKFVPYEIKDMFGFNKSDKISPSRFMEIAAEYYGKTIDELFKSQLKFTGAKFKETALGIPVPIQNNTFGRNSTTADLIKSGMEALMTGEQQFNLPENLSEFKISEIQVGNDLNLILPDSAGTEMAQKLREIAGSYGMKFKQDKNQENIRGKAEQELDNTLYDMFGGE